MGSLTKDDLGWTAGVGAQTQTFPAGNTLAKSHFTSRDHVFNSVLIELVYRF